MISGSEKLSEVFTFRPMSDKTPTDGRLCASCGAKLHRAVESTPSDVKHEMWEQWFAIEEHK
jgi:hypothetical protein